MSDEEERLCAALHALVATRDSAWCHALQTTDFTKYLLVVAQGTQAEALLRLMVERG